MESVSSSKVELGDEKNILITYDTNEQLEQTKIISLEKFIFEYSYGD